MATYMHTVGWKLQPENMEENKKVLKQKVLALKDIIPGIVSLEVFTDSDKSGTHDACIVSIFESEAALKAYDIHPEHQKVVEFVKQVIIPGTRVAIDMSTAE